MPRVPVVLQPLPVVSVDVRRHRRARRCTCPNSLTPSRTRSSTSATSASSATSSARTPRRTNGTSTSRGSCCALTPCASTPLASRSARRVTDQVLGRTDLVGHAQHRRRADRQQLRRPAWVGVSPSPGEADRHRRPACSAALCPPALLAPGSSAAPRRRPLGAGRTQATVAVFPTCFVEYQTPADRPRPRQGVRAQRRRLPGPRRPRLLRCAVAARRRLRQLHQGGQTQLAVAGRKPSAQGHDIVVPQPTCGYVLKTRLSRLCRRSATPSWSPAHTFDACEYLSSCTAARARPRHRLPRRRSPSRVAYHAPLPPPGPEHRPQEP